MRVGILSDIHANLTALEEVLKAAEREEISHWFFLGDLVGYYYWPVRCLERLEQVDAVMIGGNHERMLCMARQNPTYRLMLRGRYGNGIEAALEQCTEAQLDQLCTLPESRELELEGVRMLLCHGTPWDADAYLYPDADEEVLERVANGYDMVFYGHTHYPLVWQGASGMVVNPGSVGQPRNHRPGAHWAVVDLTTRQVEHRVEPYDIKRVQYECSRRDPGLDYLRTVLERTEQA